MTGEAKNPSGETGALDGITVLDASRVLAGPFCTMQLADLGAEVVKVERPDTGDQTRGWSPPTYRNSDVASYYLSVNRNKRSLTLNLATDEGRDLFRELATKADVLVHNFRVGRMESWDLGYETLREENPGLVYCSITGYGEWGPDRNRPAYDLVLQAEGGLMSITGEPDGQPVRVGVAATDIVTGLYSAQSILAALLERELGSGKGQKIDMSLLDSAAALNSYAAMFYFATEESPGRMGGKIPNIVPYQVFETVDDYAVIAVPSEHLWPKFCDALDRPDLLADDRFETNADRVANRDVLEPDLEDEIMEYETDEIVSLMQDHDVPATPINQMDDVYEHPQVLARGMCVSIEHPSIGTIKMPGVPMHFSRTPGSVRSHPPELGEHTRDVLRDLGYDDEAIDRLEAEDVV